MPRAEREAQMLEVAKQVFSTRGFHATTMDDIAEQVGVTKPLIYDYFGSKEGLLAATIEQARGELLAALVDAWAARPLDPPRDRVREIILAFFRFIDHHEPAYALLRSEGALVGEAGESVERTRQQTAKALAEGINTLPHFDHVPASHVFLMSEIIIGGIERLAVVRSVNPGTSADEAADLVMATSWDGLAALARA